MYHGIGPLDPERLNVFRTVREITGEARLLYGTQWRKASRRRPCVYLFKRHTPFTRMANKCHFYMENLSDEQERWLSVLGSFPAPALSYRSHRFRFDTICHVKQVWWQNIKSNPLISMHSSCALPWGFFFYLCLFLSICFGLWGNKRVAHVGERR